MKIACLYILAVCLILFGGYRYVHGAAFHNNSDNGLTQAQHIAKARLFKYTYTEQDPTIINNSLPTDVKQSIISAEFEDDDISIRRKLVLIANCFIALTYASFLLFIFNFFKRNIYNYGQLLPVGSYKYLLQGALRI